MQPLIAFVLGMVVGAICLWVTLGETHTLCQKLLRYHLKAQHENLKEGRKGQKNIEQHLKVINGMTQKRRDTHG